MHESEESGQRGEGTERAKGVAAAAACSPATVGRGEIPFVGARRLGHLIDDDLAVGHLIEVVPVIPIGVVQRHHHSMEVVRGGRLFDHGLGHCNGPLSR